MPVDIVFGAGGIGSSPFARTWTTPEEVSQLLDVLERLDIRALDSAATYPPGNSWHAETLLGQTQAVERGFIIDSKVIVEREGPSLHDTGITSSIEKTLPLLRTKTVRIYYAHTSDPATPLEETAASFDKQFKEGKFQRLGLSNFSAENLATYFEICDNKGYVKPTVYQGSYSALYRVAEDDIFPLLRKHKCVFYAFSPLAGGFLTGKVTFASNKEADLKDTRWVGSGGFPKRFDKPAMHGAMRHLRTACDEATPTPLSTQEAALRWLMHHSALRDGDAIILGATKIPQLVANVADAKKGPLEGRIRHVIDQLWDDVLTWNGA